MDQIKKQQNNQLTYIYRVIGYESPDKDIKLDIDQNDYNDSESSVANPTSIELT